MSNEDKQVTTARASGEGAANSEKAYYEGLFMPELLGKRLADIGAKFDALGHQIIL